MSGLGLGSRYGTEGATDWLPGFRERVEEIGKNYCLLPENAPRVKICL